MFLKHIICTVKPGNRLAFSEAQKTWSKIKGFEGFIAQIGGWNQNDPNEAVILSFWKDKSSLDNFMDKMHDDIFYKSKQLQTYDDIIISYFKFNNHDIGKTIFINEIDIVKNLITTNTNDDSSLKIDFMNHTIRINAQNLKNGMVSLIDSWKVI